MSLEIPPRVLVVGLGSSGLAAVRLAASDGAEIWVTDLRGEAELAADLAALAVDVRTFLGGHPESCLDGVGLVVVSPGVPADAPLLAAARRRGTEVNTEIEFAWRHRPQAELVAVTGSNGKSTVTELTARMLVEAGQSAVAGGNLGPPASQLVLEGGSGEIHKISSGPGSEYSHLTDALGYYVYRKHGVSGKQIAKSEVFF